MLATVHKRVSQLNVDRLTVIVSGHHSSKQASRTRLVIVPSSEGSQLIGVPDAGTNSPLLDAIVVEDGEGNNIEYKDSGPFMFREFPRRSPPLHTASTSNDFSFRLLVSNVLSFLGLSLFTASKTRGAWFTSLAFCGQRRAVFSLSILIRTRRPRLRPADNVSRRK